MNPYFTIKDLKINHKTFEGSKNVLDIDNITINKGKTYGLVGESNAGKTVLALAILRLLATPPGEIVSGEILLNGENLLKKTEREMTRIRGKKIAMIFQDPMSTLNPVLTVGYQMKQIILKDRNIYSKEAERKAIEMINKVKISDAENIMEKYPHELSGGQRQRIIIGMALLCGAEFIIADEPTRNLDVTIQAGILKLISQLQQEFKVTVLFIANNLGLVSAVCDEIGVLYKGQIVERGNIRDVMENPQHEYTKILLEAAKTKRKQEKEADQEPGEVILKVDNLKKYFPVKNEFFSKKNLFVKAVDDVSLELRKGEVLGIVGESGCGKSTLVNTILCLHEPTEGKVIFDGHDVYSLKKEALRKIRKSIQIVFQDPYWSLNPRMLVKNIIGEPLKVHEHLKSDEYIDRIQNLMETVGLPKEGVFQYPHEFSGGQRQRIAIARSLSVKPKLVVLDEPTSSIDVLSQAFILKLLNELKKKLHLTYVLISHDLGVVNYMSDKIIVMYLGKIVEYGRAETIFNNPKHPYTVALFNAIPNLKTRSVEDLVAIQGDVPSAINPPEGCRFHPRCTQCMDICKNENPEMLEVEGRYAACHLYRSDIMEKALEPIVS